VSRIYVPTRGPEDWQRLLADPELHWREGYSAMSLAQSWEAAHGLPAEIAALFRRDGIEPELLLALPEHQVPLPGARRGASQCDVFALIRAGDHTVAAAIEGKVDESFGPLLGDWRRGASPGKQERLAFIADLLGLTLPLPDDVHYQLLHRTAAAVIEARRFKTDEAAMIVHSFSPTKKWFDAFERFVGLFGKQANRGGDIIALSGHPPVNVGWATPHAGVLQTSPPLHGRPPEGEKM